MNFQMNQNNNLYGQEEKVKPNTGWILFGFSFPLIGLILYFRWKETKKSDAKGALIGSLIIIIFLAVYLPFSILSHKKFKNERQYDYICSTTYGYYYVYKQENNKNYCIDIKSGEKILIKDFSKIKISPKIYGEEQDEEQYYDETGDRIDPDGINATYEIGE